ncbi:MAG TPA: hypothetical protein VME42_02935 [Steroidobacteraceae bacterium]|nr:hypothetical protein [Steroidobacteraceae bacterium]
MAALTSVNLDEHLSKAGLAARSFARLCGTLWHQERLPGDLLELCRLTLARLHADSQEMAALNTELPPSPATAQRRRAVLEGTAGSDPAFSAADRAVLEFTELFWMDAQSIDDAAAEAVTAYHGEAGLVFLIEALGLIDGRIRAARCLRDIAALAGS